MMSKSLQEKFYSDSHFPTDISPRISFHSLNSGLEIVIETESLTVRSYRDEDFKKCINLYGDPKLMKYFDYGYPLNSKELEALIRERSLRFRQARKPLGLFSVFNKDSGVFCGQFDLLPLGEAGVAEIGCILLKEYQNKGICKRICKIFLLEYIPMINQMNKIFVSEEIPIRKVIGTCHPKNYPSKRTLESLGMVCFQKSQRFNQSRLWYTYVVPEYAENARKRIPHASKSFC